MIVGLQAEDGIRDRVRLRGLGDVYKRQAQRGGMGVPPGDVGGEPCLRPDPEGIDALDITCILIGRLVGRGVRLRHRQPFQTWLSRRPARLSRCSLGSP